MRKFWKDESGSSATEYALILAVVAVVMGGAALALGNNTVFSVAQAANALDAINDGPAETAGSGGGGSTGGGSIGGGGGSTGGGSTGGGSTGGGGGSTGGGSGGGGGSTGGGSGGTGGGGGNGGGQGQGKTK